MRDYKNTNQLSNINIRNRHIFPFDTNIPVLTLSSKIDGMNLDCDTRHAVLDKKRVTGSWCGVFLNFVLNQVPFPIEPKLYY